MMRANGHVGTRWVHGVIPDARKSALTKNGAEAEHGIQIEVRK